MLHDGTNDPCAYCGVYHLPWMGLPGKPRKLYEFVHIVWEYDGRMTPLGRRGWYRGASYSVWANYSGALVKEVIPDTSGHLRRKEPAQLELF